MMLFMMTMMMMMMLVLMTGGDDGDGDGDGKGDAAHRRGVDGLITATLTFTLLQLLLHCCKHCLAFGLGDAGPNPSRFGVFSEAKPNQGPGTHVPNAWCLNLNFPVPLCLGGGGGRP